MELRPIRIVCLVGHPASDSRTRRIAETATNAVAKHFMLCDEPTEIEIIECAALGSALLDWGSPIVDQALATIQRADVMVVASPTFKATYSGILKLLLDRFEKGGLSGQPVVPLQVGAAREHALSVDVHLRPLLLEIGACCPTQSLFILESAIGKVDETISNWALTELNALLGVVFARRSSSIQES